MAAPKPDEASIFNAARRIEDCVARRQYVGQMCGEDLALAGRVEALLRAHDEGPTFLGSPARELEDLLGGSSEQPTVAHAPTPGDEGSPHVPVAPAQAGRYVIRGEIAHGGMGAVLHGRDTAMDRDLAIKVLRAGPEAGPEQVRRFFHEARVHGRLQHPGVVPIYEMGELPEQGPYFTMKLVQGQTLAALLHDRADADQDRPRFLQIFEQVCQTLAYAHACGVVHRDLKPANIMVGAFGEVQVMDWGLAKVLTGADVADPAPAAPADPVRAPAAADQTEAGTILGTPAYMAPEQARGDVERIDERADVFGLGAILCDILTGQPPFAGPTMDALRQAAAGDLADACARLDASGADPELVRLGKQCLAQQRDARPRDAGAVAGSMTAYLVGVQERLRSAEVERAAALAKEAEARAKAAAERRARHLTVGLAGALLLLAALATGGWLWLEQRRATTTAAVNEAFVTAKLLHERAGGDLAQLSRAVAAFKEAQALAEGGYCDEALRAQVQKALAQAEGQEQDARRQAEREAKHRQMLARLEDIRLQVATQDASSEGDGHAAAALAYEKTLAGWQLDVDRLSVDEAAARVRAYPAPLVRALAGALDHWVLCGVVAYGRQAKKSFAGTSGFSLASLLGAKHQAGLVALLPKWRHRLAVAQQVDPDPLRHQLREALLRYDTAQLKRVARTADAAALPTDTIQNLAPLLWAIGDKQLTLDLLRKAATARPDDFWIHHYLGFFAMQVGRRDEALCHATATASLKPQSALALLNLGAMFVANGRYDEALAVLQRAPRMGPQASGVHFHIGSALRAKGDLPGAITHFRDALRLEPGKVLFHHSLASALRANKDLSGALAAYQAALAADPRDGESRWQIGQILREQGKPAEALDPLGKAARLAPHDVRYALALADTLRDLRKWDEALAEYQRVVRLAPTSGAGHYGLGRVLRERGKAEAALAEFAAAVRLQPDLKDAHELLGQALEARGGDATAAVTAHRNMLRRWPADAGARTRLAAALLRQGESQRHTGAWPAAVISFRESLALRPNEPAALQGLSQTLLVLRRYPEAVLSLSQLVALRPDDTQARRQLGATCLLAGQPAQAVTAFREVLRRGPATADDHFQLGKSLLLATDVAGAVAELREAVRLMPSRGDFQQELAAALRRNKQLSEALAACREAVRLMPRAASAHLLLGQILMDQGHAAEALAAFREVMRLEPTHDGCLLIGEGLLARGSVEDAIAYLTNPGEPWIDEIAQAYTACLVLHGKSSEYRTCCAALLKHYRHTRQELAAFWMARCLSLAPDTGTDPAEAVRLAERTVEAHPTHGWYLNALALAHLRAGQPEKAIERAQEALRVAPSWQPWLQWLVLSLAHQRLGDTAEARRWLDKARQAPTAPPGVHVQDRIFCECLLREAEAAAKAPGGKK
jgi:serine/threonine-protein kinase